MENNQSKLFKDDVTEVIPDLFLKPSLCSSCRKDRIIGGEEDMVPPSDPNVLAGKARVKCYAYESKEIHKGD